MAHYVTTIIPIDNCTRYYWRAKANFPEVDDEPYSEPWSFVTHIPGTLCPAGPLVPGIPPESIIPIARLLENANCRSGPTTEYQIMDILPDGTELPIQGQNRAGDSWLVKDPTIGRNCWVSGSMVEVIGDTSLVEIIDPDPPTTPTSPPPQVNCAQYTSNYCNAQPACTLTANGCVNK